MGDVILTTPLLRALRQRHPDADIAYLTRPAFVPLLEHHPAQPRILPFDPASEPLAALARQLRGERFTHHLDLHGVGRTRVLRLLVPGRWCGYSKRRLARWALVHLKRNIYRDSVPEAERFFEAARDLDVVPDGRPADVGIGDAAAARAEAWLTDHRLGGTRPLVSVVPGAAHFTKRWPVEHWIALTHDLVTRGYDVLVLGGRDYVDACAAIAEAGSGHAASSAGLLGLQETARLLECSRVAVAGDTGLMHLATAVGTPVVALYGPTVRQFGFTPYRARAALLERDLPCRPCSAQGGPACPLGHHRCLRDIAPADVCDRALRLLA
jgi:heptosyltransferase-2